MSTELQHYTFPIEGLTQEGDERCFREDRPTSWHPIPESHLEHAIQSHWIIRRPVPPQEPLGEINQDDSNAAFQYRVAEWLRTCFGYAIANDKMERNHRFFEEASEVVQAAGMTISEAHQLVDYVFGREVGELKQEVGGAMVTLAALCYANGVDAQECAMVEVERIYTKMPEIRAKQAQKPKHGPLPEESKAQPAAQEGKKSDGQVLYEIIHHWKHTSGDSKTLWEEWAAAFRAHVLAPQPSDSNRDKASKFFKSRDGDEIARIAELEAELKAQGQKHALALHRLMNAEAAQKSPWVKTAERLPTEAHASKQGKVVVTDGEGTLWLKTWDEAYCEKYWLDIRPPVEPEEEWKKWDGTLRGMWREVFESIWGACEAATRKGPTP